MKKHSAPLVLALALVAALALAACGGGSDSSSSAADSTAADTASTESVIGGGSATCDQATFDAWVKAYGEQNGNTATLAAGGFTCADGWAVLFPTINADAADGYDETVVVQAEGPSWALMARDKVCGDSADTSEVPAALYQPACQTN